MDYNDTIKYIAELKSKHGTPWEPEVKTKFECDAAMGTETEQSAGHWNERQVGLSCSGGQHFEVHVKTEVGAISLAAEELELSMCRKPRAQRVIQPKFKD